LIAVLTCRIFSEILSSETLASFKSGKSKNEEAMLKKIIDISL